MRPLLGALVALAALAMPAAARAQSSTSEMLQRAVGLYQDLQVERALEILRQIISPSSPFEVSRSQRVEAYKYLGASLAILGKADSARVYFRAALERDPFVDLDAGAFTPVERAVFAEARQRTFALALRPLEARRIDPASETVSFQLATTHLAEVRLTVWAADGTDVATLLKRDVAGGLEVRWSGLRADGRLAPPGRYELRIAARSRLTGVEDSSRAYFDLVHERPPLEDTLPSYGPGELLPERHPPSAARTDLLKGLGVAAAALVLPRVLGNGALGKGQEALVYPIAGAASVTGIVASLRRQRHPEIRENIAENRRREEARMRANLELERRNAERVSMTKLLIAPAAGIGP